MTDVILKKGRVFRAVGGKFYVFDGENIVTCTARGIIRLESDIVVGDIVEFDSDFVIRSYIPRRNEFIRPQSANIDLIIVVCASVPAPDFLLIDKLAIKAALNDVDLVLCVNKDDLKESAKLYDRILFEYGKVTENIVKVSAVSGDIDQLLPLLNGKLCCFAGQSAVGKSSIVNALIPGTGAAVGGISKIERGRHTTRHAEIFPHAYGGMILDTPGFSKLDIFEVPSRELNLFYPEYLELKCGCKYTGCTHTFEPSCAVKDAVSGGKLSQERHNRYLQLFSEIDNRRKW